MSLCCYGLVNKRILKQITGFGPRIQVTVASTASVSVIFTPDISWESSPIVL